jgi:alkanesulfonate monooxygenase SsuD/methylene tetrahydromethanopterin reductase-like flavin-dependent oxidoreductase (luciferase family)
MTTRDRPVKFGWIAPTIGVPESHGEAIVLQELDLGVLAAVNTHFDSVWVPDHFYGFDRVDDAYVECWTTMTWLAAKLPDILVGGMVMCNDYRDPTVVAHMGKTLQAFSGGRLVLGYGAGWREAEYRSHGFDFGSAATRIRRLDEAITIIRSMWTESRTSFEGQFYAIKDVVCEPKPRPVPPILIGGAGEQLMLRLVARHADWWNINADPATYAHKLAVLGDRCGEVGRDIDMIVKTVQIELPPPGDPEVSRRMVEQFRRYVDLGVTHFMLDFGVVNDPGIVARLGEEVFQPFRT